MQQIYICEDSLEGIFSGIYKAYENKVNPTQCKLQVGEEQNLELFASYTQIKADETLALKVSDTICRTFGEENYQEICMALCTPDKEKADAVYHTIVEGLTKKSKGRLLDDLTNPYIRKVAALKKNAWNEIHHWMGFLRFEELQNGILMARIKPKNNVLPFLALHFANRLPLEQFVIYDTGREMALIHPPQRACMLVCGEELNEEAIAMISEEEKQYRALFVHFCNTIGIQSRKNPKLQRQLLPLRFREHMVEFAN